MSQWLVWLFQGSQLETGHLSDTTASAPGSDDEGLSTAATDGSNLRTSPAEQAGSAGSESGGSNIDSVSGEKMDLSFVVILYVLPPQVCKYLRCVCETYQLSQFKRFLTVY